MTPPDMSRYVSTNVHHGAPRRALTVTQAAAHRDRLARALRRKQERTT